MKKPLFILSICLIGLGGCKNGKLVPVNAPTQTSEWIMDTPYWQYGQIDYRDTVWLKGHIIEWDSGEKIFAVLDTQAILKDPYFIEHICNDRGKSNWKWLKDAIKK